MWLATIILWRNYSGKWGKVKYYFILGIPLVYFLTQFVTLFPNLTSILLQSNPVTIFYMYILLFSFSKPLGGALFGFAFWRMTKKPRSRNPLETVPDAIWLRSSFVLSRPSNSIWFTLPYTTISPHIRDVPRSACICSWWAYTTPRYLWHKMSN